MLARPDVIASVIGTQVEPAHFRDPAMRLIFHEIVSAYYADEPTDPITVGASHATALSRAWRCEEDEVPARLEALAARLAQGSPVAHAKVVKREADLRALAVLAESIQTSIAEGATSPEELAGEISLKAMQIATASLSSAEILPFAELGRRFVRDQRRLMAAHSSGVEIGAYFGLAFLDDHLGGLRPSELFFVAGEPGAGKSAVVWRAGQQFAERQSVKPKDRQVGTLILSLEMAEEPSSIRVAQGVTGLDGGMLREGRGSEGDLSKIVSEWGRRKDLPLYFNHASTMRASQLRALVVEAIRRFNVGLVIIDHLRYMRMDGNWRNQIEEEEELVRFLKQEVATQLNVAVIVLAHTIKLGNREDGRPKMADLRGGQMVSAHADFIGFVYRPFHYADQEQIDDGKVKRTDAEFIFAKNRHKVEGSSRFFFDPSSMSVYSVVLALVFLAALLGGAHAPMA